MPTSTVEQTTRMNSFKTTTKLIAAGLAALALVTLGFYSMPQTDSLGNALKPAELYAGGNYYRYTGHNHGSAQIIYLDRHNVDCGNDFINYFRGYGNFRYQYRCMRSNGLANMRKYGRSTGYAWGGQYNLNYLDRQNVYCPSNEVLTRFQMGTISHYRFKYDYTCAQANWRSLSCTSHATGWNTYENMHYLDRHTIDCGTSKALQGFDVDSHTFREVTGRYWWWGWRNRYGNVNKIKYNYRCCSMADSYPTAYPIARPTAYPIARPTAKPISDPTAKPISDPTESPTEIPISDPTEAPIADPTQNPVADPTMAPTINTTPLVCKMTFNKKADAYTGDLPDGCALVSTEDIGWEKFTGTAPGVMLCGSAQVADFEKAGLNKGISYIYAAKSMTATTYTEVNYKGTKHFFSDGMPSVVHDHNDEVHSIQFVSDAHAEGVPTECAMGEKIDIAEKVALQVELNEEGKVDQAADEAAEKAADVEA